MICLSTSFVCLRRHLPQKGRQVLVFAFPAYGTRAEFKFPYLLSPFMGRVARSAERGHCFLIIFQLNKSSRRAILRGGFNYFLIFRISSAEQSRKVHNFDSVASVGCALPDKYCETVGQETPIAFAISVLLLPDISISCLIFSEMSLSRLSFILLFY